MSAALAVLVVLSSLALPSLLAGSDSASSPAKTTTQEKPISAWDFRWYNSSDGGHQANTPFSKLALSKNLTSAQAMSISSGGEEVSFQVSSVSLTEGEGPWKASSSSSARINGTGADFDSAFGSDYSIQFINALNGIKTLLKVAVSPGSSGDLMFTLQLDYNTTRLAIYADGDKIDLFASDAKKLELRDSSGDAVFEMPEPLIWDSPDLVYDEMKKEWVENWSTVDYLKGSFSVSTADGITAVTVAVPQSYLTATTTRYPIFVDPSLGPYISTSVQVTDEVVYQESALTITSGGTLKLVNSSLIFNGSYQFQVYSGGKLELINSTVTVNNTATHRITMTVNGQLYANYSTIEYTQTGVVVASSTLFLNHSTVRQSLANGITLNSGVGQQILNSTVCTNNGVGLSAAAGVTGVRLFDSTVCSNGGGGASFGTGTGLEIVRTTFQSNGGTALSLSGAASKTLESDRFLSNFVAVAVSASDHYLDNCTVDDSTLWDYQITGGTLWSRACWFSRPKVDAQGSAKVVGQWLLNITVLDAQGNSVGNQAVTIYNRTGSTVASGNTNATGFLSVLISEFNQTAAGREYYSPHTMDYGADATDQGIPIDVEGNRSLTLRQGGDADADLAPNSDESNSDSHWFEAEHWAPKLAWIANDTAAVGGKAVQPLGISANADFLQTSVWDAYPAGDYLAYFLLRSSAGDANATVTLRVDGGGGQLASRSLSFNDSSYVWFTLGPFSTGGAGNVTLKPRILAGTNASSVFVDRVMLVRTFDGTADLNRSYSFSDWLTADTDTDGAPDGVELVRADHWKEAETLTGAPINDDPLAANRQAASHADNTALVGSWAVTDNFQAGDYQVWIKARSTHGSSDYGITIDVDGTAASPGNADGTAASQYLWFHTDNFTIATDDTHTIVAYVNDSGDPDTGDANDYLLLDKVLIWKAVDYSGTYVPFRVSDAFDIDTDRDNLTDGQEGLGYFTADRQEAENYTGQNFTTPWENGIAMDDSADNFTLEWEVRERGYYQLRFPVVQAMHLGSESAFQDPCTEADLLWFTNLTVFDSVGQEVARTSSDAYVHAISQPQATPQQWVNRSVVTMYRYFFDVAEYSGFFSINATANASFWQQCGSPDDLFGLSYDALFIQKQVLNTLDVDYENDGLWDGHEYIIETFPLNVDSDYDALTDFEEVYPASDGYRTNALSNDTDRDGLLDPVEDGLSGWDADNSTKTNPSNEDTDGDRVPDGWVDGWGYSAIFEYWSRSLNMDGTRQFWEGEDINLNGAKDNIDGSAWNGTFQFDASTKEARASETDPTSADTDGDTIHDGWEMAIWGYVIADPARPMLLNPLDNSDAQTDVDYNLTTWVQEGDGISTVKEYNLNLNPFIKDSDGDFITDGQETKVGLRTNLSAGMHWTYAYAGALSSDWIFFDPNPFNSLVAGHNYTFSTTTTNASGQSEYNSSAWPLRLVYTLWDGSKLYWNLSSDRIYVWTPNADPEDADHNGILQGLVYRFDRNDSVVGEGSLDPVLSYRWREAPVQMDPHVRDSDADEVIDGYDGWNATSTASWKTDIDNDGLVNAADTDSDGDLLSDGQENGNGNALFEPARHELNAYNNDTDSDGLNDGADALPMDRDNDNETGWNSFNNSFGSFPAFAGMEATLGTDPGNPDTDNDGLQDGTEDANRNGAFNPMLETNATDVDTDDDGLWDGYNRTVGGVTYWGELNFSTSTISNDTDRDRVQDGTEVGLTGSFVLGGDGNGTNASRFMADADSSTRTDPLNPDTDGDGLWDGWEDLWFWNGVLDTYEFAEDKNRDGKLDWNETDPLKTDTDDDRLGDYREVVILRSNATNPDTDGDGLMDPYEPYPTMDYNNDTETNIRDTDSDTDTVSDSSEVTNRTVFKTNATNGSFVSGTWVTVMWTDGDSSLTKFAFDRIIGLSDLSGLWPVNFTADLVGPDNQSMHPQVVTPDGYALWKNATHIFVQLKYQYVVYRPWNNTTDPAIPGNGTDLIDHSDYAREYRLAYNWSLVLNNDNDHDGLAGGLDPNNNNPDTDSDGLIDGLEYYVYRTNVSSNDTDLDGLLDGWEATNWTNPSNPDTDNDGLWDGENLAVNGTFHLGERAFGTDPMGSDSDYDGVPDGYEANRGLPPMNGSASHLDSDHDGTTDQAEYNWNIAGGWYSAPAQIYIGGNLLYIIWLPNGVWWNGTNASNPDSDGDGMPDGWEIGWNRRALKNDPGSPDVLDPLNATDNTTDADNDGLWNYDEYVYRYGGDIDPATWNYTTNGLWLNGTNPLIPDTDHDGLPDYWEAKENRTTNATSWDTDGDNLRDLVEINGWTVNITLADGTDRSWWGHSDPTAEYTSGGSWPVPDDIKMAWFLDPRRTDTDGDGLLDGLEINLSGDPERQYDPTRVETVPPTITNVTNVLVQDDEGRCWIHVEITAQDVVQVVSAEAWLGGTHQTMTAIRHWLTGGQYGTDLDVTEDGVVRRCAADHLAFPITLHAWDYVGNEHDIIIEVGTDVPGPGERFLNWLASVPGAVGDFATLTREVVIGAARATLEASLIGLLIANSMSPACFAAGTLANMYYHYLDNLDAGAALAQRQAMNELLLVVTHLDAVVAANQHAIGEAVRFAVAHGMMDELLGFAGAQGEALAATRAALVAETTSCFLGNAIGNLAGIEPLYLDFEQAFFSQAPANNCGAQPTQVEVAVLFGRTVDHAPDPRFTHAYYQNMADRVRSYWCEVSRGEILLHFTLFDNNAAWYDMPHDRTLEGFYSQRPHVTDYYRDLQDAATNQAGFDVNNYNITIHVMPDLGQQDMETYSATPLGGALQTHPAMRVEQNGRNITMSEFYRAGAWAHEIGHALSVPLGEMRGTSYPQVEDLYYAQSTTRICDACGEVGRTSLMSGGGTNGVPTQEFPTTPGAYALQKLGEATYADVQLDGTAHDLRLASDPAAGAQPVALRVWTDANDTNSNDAWSNYFVEARSTNPAHSFWDKASPPSGVYVYRVTNRINAAGDLLPENGDDRGWTVHLVAILTPDGGDPGLSWENVNQIIPGRQPQAFSPGFVRGIYYENDGPTLADRLVIRITNWVGDANGFPVYHVVFDTVPPAPDPLAPWRFDYAGLTDAQITTLVTGLLFPVGTFIGSYLSMLQLAVRVGEITYNTRFL